MHEPMSAAAPARERRMSAFDHAMAPILPVLLAVAALGCLAGIFRAAAIIPLHVSLDPNEGWNAYHAAAAMAGHGLYPARDSFMVNNYPPLSFYLVGLLGLATGDQIVAGRIVSLVSFVFICVFTMAALRRMGARFEAALFAAVFLAATLILASDYVGMDDPQLLGHALQLAALVLLLREPRMPRTVFLASALFVAGGFVKHDLFVLPVATLAWIGLCDRRRALSLAAMGLALSLGGLALFRLYFGFDLLAQLASARQWSLEQLKTSLDAWLPFAAVPMIGVVGVYLWRAKDSPVLFVAIYAALAVYAGIFMSGGAGVDVNAMFDADIALALGAGLALGRLLEARAAFAHIVGRILAFAAFVPFVLLASQSLDWRDWSFWLHPMRDETALAAQDIAFLRAHQGPAICESLALCYWAGKPGPVDVFNLDEQILTGRRDPEPLLQAISTHRFATLELDETDPFPLPGIVRGAILYNYRMDHADDEGTFLVPR
jgi:hypothetical protein